MGTLPLNCLHKKAMKFVSLFSGVAALHADKVQVDIVAVSF